MVSYQSVLRDALELSDDERALLIGHIESRLDNRQPTHAEFVEQLRRIDGCTDEHPESLKDWPESEAEIFGSRRGGIEVCRSV